MGRLILYVFDVDGLYRSRSLSSLGAENLLDPGEPGDRGGKGGRGDGQESDVAEFVGRDPQLKGPAGIGPDRSLR